MRDQHFTRRGNAEEEYQSLKRQTPIIKWTHWDYEAIKDLSRD